MKTITKFTGLAFATLALICFAVLSTPNAFGVNPPPEGGYTGWNTAEGQDALFNLTNGTFNTAIGGHALYGNRTGNSNTAVGAFSLAANSSGYQNVAIGQGTLRNNTTGPANTGTGFQALFSNTTGYLNTAIGIHALYQNTIGTTNIAVGSNVLYSNSTGGGNTAAGASAMYENTTGIGNTANGYKALLNNTTGDNNTAIGEWALYNNTTGTNNIGIGPYGLGGYDIVTADHVIAIGHPGQNVSNSCWIGNIATSAVTGSAVYISSDGRLGLLSSSHRFKKEIKPMDKASEAILALKPVTFQYKSDDTDTPQFGLIAEEVEKVNPNLVVRDKEGKPYSVRYDQVNAMLLNEFLKEHRKVEQWETTAAQQAKEIKALTAALKDQAAQIEKISAQLETSSPIPQVVVN